MDSSREVDFQKLKKLHDDAYKTIEIAIQLEEDGEIEKALSKYESGLDILDDAIETRIECPSNPDMQWEKACSMVQKMKKTKKEVLCRISECQKSFHSTDTTNDQTRPPSYEEAMAVCNSSTNSSSASKSTLTTYSELAAALRNLKLETCAKSAHILYSCPNVQIYFISSDGAVKSTLQPDTLTIVELEDEGDERLRKYLQVGEWIYPLIPGVSPCLRTEYGAFILPDVLSTEEGDTVGIILPQDADASLLDLLNDILQGMVEGGVAAPADDSSLHTVGRGGRHRRDLSFSISQGIVRGAHMVSQGIVRGAEKASQVMNYGTPKLISHIQPQEHTGSVNPKVQTGLQVAKNVSYGAVMVTGYLATRIGAATMALGRYLAPHIQRQGTRLLTSTGLTEREAADKVSGVLQVTAGAVEGFTTVYDGLENAAKILGTSLTDNTVKIVQHKYGQPVGVATGDAMYTVGNVFVAGNNIRHLTPKGLVKTGAKQTGKAVIEDYRRNLQSEEGPSHQSPGPFINFDK